MVVLYRCALFVVVFLSLLLIVVGDCSDQNDCTSDALQNSGEYVRCDMCVCDNFGDVSNDGDESACSGFSNTYYKCYVKSESINKWHCRIRMKTDWLIAFIFIAVGGFLILVSAVVLILRLFFPKRLC